MLMETQKRRSLGSRHAKKYAIKPTIPSVMTTIEEDAFLGGLDANKVKIKKATYAPKTIVYSTRLPVFIRLIPS